MRCEPEPIDPPGDPIAALSARVARLEAAQGELLSTGEAARRLGIDRSTVWRLVERGECPTTKIGNRHRIPAGWVADRLREAG